VAKDPSDPGGTLSVLEVGGKFDPAPAREETRSQLALLLTFLVFLIALMLVIFLATNLLSADETKELAATVLSPVVAVTGTALGFYFGGHRSGDGG
jgi:uncharacterized membrane protein